MSEGQDLMQVPSTPSTSGEDSPLLTSSSVSSLLLGQQAVVGRLPQHVVFPPVPSARRGSSQATQRSQLQQRTSAVSTSPHTSSPLSSSSSPLQTPAASNPSAPNPPPKEELAPRRTKAEQISMKNTFVSRAATTSFSYRSQIAVIPSAHWVPFLDKHLDGGGEHRINRLHEACDNAGLSVIPSLYTTMSAQDVKDHLEPLVEDVLGRFVYPYHAQPPLCCNHTLRFVNVS